MVFGSHGKSALACHSGDTAAARNLLAIAVSHTVTRSAVANMAPDTRVVTGNVVLL